MCRINDHRHIFNRYGLCSVCSKSVDEIDALDLVDANLIESDRFTWDNDQIEWDSDPSG